MTLRYVIHQRKNPAIYWIDETKSPAPVTFATEHEAETFLWKQDALVVMDASIGIVMQDTSDW